MIGTVANPTQRLPKIGFELGERSLDPARSTDEDKIGPGDSGFGQNDPGELAEASPHPVADHGVADLLRDGEAETHGGIAVIARPDEEDEARHRRAQARIGREEVRAAREPADILRD